MAVGVRVVTCPWCHQKLGVAHTKPGRYLARCPRCLSSWEVRVTAQGTVEPVYTKCSDLQKVQCP